MYDAPAWRRWVPLALLVVLALSFLLLSGGREKRALGFYSVRPLAWWGSGESIHVILWNSEGHAVDVNVSGDISCSTSVPPFSAVETLCKTSPTSPGEYRDLNVCINDECGRLSLVFD